jgi:SAM-dependent methyltransferase
MRAYNPYDELPYKSCPIDWTSPERLALVSLLHGGPRPPLDSYRVLELGCGAGQNLLPLAYYRSNAAFVGVDGAESQIKMAESRRSRLEVSNLEFIHADFRNVAHRLSGQFDYILAHGVFSWVTHEIRESLLKIFAAFLRPGGLLYVNYNARPGWNVRGLVREFLLAQTAGEMSLRSRAFLAKKVASRVVAAMTGVEHPYSQLLANEFGFVGEGDVTWIGHEFLAPENHPYWRSDFLSLMRLYGFEYVADSDFNYISGRMPEYFLERLFSEGISCGLFEDTVDLFCYRQVHSPILTSAPLRRVTPSVTEFGKLFVASCLEPFASTENSKNPMFQHPSGFKVETKEEGIRIVLNQLVQIWPRGLPVEIAFDDVSRVVDDLKLLHRNGLIELRCVDQGDCGIPSGPLNKHEEDWGGYRTTPYHTTEVTDPNVSSKVGADLVASATRKLGQ